MNEINKINFKQFLENLKEHATQTFQPAAIITFMQTIGGKNKTGGNNSATRLQYFLNAYAEESALIAANSGRLAFIADDHGDLITNSHGNDFADFKFTDITNNNCTIEAKYYYSIDSYYANLNNTNFHNADYVISFIFKENCWCVSSKSEEYKILYQGIDIKENIPIFNDFIFPTSFTTISFGGKDFSKLSDDEVLKMPEVYYRFWTHNNIK